MKFIKKIKPVFPILLVALLSYNANCQNEWSVFIGKKNYVSISHLPDHNYIPDGHISVLPESNGQYIMYWSEYRNSRTTGNTQFPESQKTLEPQETIFGGRAGNEGPSNDVNDGGSWLMSVHRHNNGDTLIGFYHGESHWYPRNGNFTAWKSLCVAYSYDNGFNWVDMGQIVTSDRPKPLNREWGGAGDCCVVWDSTYNRWNCYFQEHNIRLAVSYDPLGAPGTWIKYYNGDFNETGLGGLSSPLNNLSQAGGANPSVHWNTFYEKWVMTYHGWDGGIYVTRSQDGINWAFPNKIILKGDFNKWYPTIIGETDTKAGKLARIYYGEFYTSTGWRFLVGHDILFDSTSYNYGYINTPWEATHIGPFNFSGKAGINNETLTITGTTNFVNEENDASYFMYRHVGSNGELSSHLSYQTDYNNKAFSGIMLRASLDAGAKFVSLGKKSSADTIQIKYRSENNSTTIEEYFQNSSKWMKTKKNNSTIDILISEDGVTWNILKSIALDLPSDFYAGFYNTSHDDTTFCTAKFDQLIMRFQGVGIDDSQFEQIELFPNPAEDILNINLGNKYEQLDYKITGIDGKLHKVGTIFSDRARIELVELPKNHQFIIQLFNKSTVVFTKKFIKM